MGRILRGNILILLVLVMCACGKGDDAPGPAASPFTGSYTSASFTADGGERTIKVFGDDDIEWEIAAYDIPWISLSESSGTGDGSIVVTADPLTLPGGREALLTIRGAGAEHEVRVVQSGTPDEECFVEFDDAIFESYCLENFDFDLDGKLSTMEASMAGAINVMKLKISSLRGLEHFTGITDLNCSQTQVTSVDTGANPLLNYLSCTNLKLEWLDISHLASLFEVRCTRSGVRRLTVGAQPDLEDLYADSCRLERIDVSQCPRLRRLDCSYNEMESLDCSSNPNLVSLACDGNKLTALNLSLNPSLYNLSCSKNALDALDLSHNPELKLLVCGKNPMTQLDLSPVPKLRNLDIEGLPLTELDISGCRELEILLAGKTPSLEVIYVWEGFDPDDYQGFRTSARFEVKQ